MATDKTTLEVEVKASGIRETTDKLRDMGRAGESSSASISDLAKKIAGFTTAANLAVSAAQAVASATIDAGRRSIELAASFEKARVSWGVLVGDVATGNEIFNQLQEFAARTPLSFEAVETTARTLSGFGVELADLIPTLSKLGDVSLGDSQKLGQLALVFGQVKAQGRAMTQDLYQFVNAGVPIFQMLADVTGVTAGEIKELASQGKIGYDEIAAAIDKATSAGGKFSGMMEKTAETTAGKFSTFLDNVNQRLAAMGSVFLPAVNAALDAMNDAMTRANERDLITSFESGKYTGDIGKIVEVLQKRIKEQELLVQFDPNFAMTAGVELDRLNRLYQQAMYMQASEARRNAEAKRQQVQAGSANQATQAILPYVVPEMPLVSLSQFGHTAPTFSPGVVPSTLSTEFFGPGQDKWVENLNYALEISSKYADKNKILAEQINKLNEAFARGDIDSGVYARAMEDLQGQLDRLDEKTLAYKNTLNELRNAFGQIGESVYIETFKSIGEYLASGADNADSFEKAMLSMVVQIANQLPLMFLSAGLQLITVGQIPLGITLLGMAGITAIGAGALDYAQGQMSKNAIGGVYASASLQSYSNGVYDTPKVFAFAKGVGIFGEAGPEAIMPLKRTSNGELGVKATAGNVNVVVNNYSNAEVKTSVETLSDGTRQVVMTIENVVKSMIPSGKLDGVLYRGGLKPIGVRG